MSSKERLVFQTAVEGLFIRGVGSKLTPAIKSEIKAVGIDLDKPLLPAYPPDQYHQAIEIVARRAYPELSVDKAHYELGARMIHGLVETIVGKGLAAFAKMLGPKRSLLKVAQTSKTSTNFSHNEGREIGPTEVEVVAQPYVGRPELMQGSLAAAAELAGGKNARCEINSWDPATEKLVLRVKWD